MENGVALESKRDAIECFSLNAKILILINSFLDDDHVHKHIKNVKNVTVVCAFPEY